MEPSPSNNTSNNLDHNSSPQPLKPGPVKQIDNDKDKSILNIDNEQQIMNLTTFTSSNRGGIYIPPFRMNSLIHSVREKNDQQSIEYQKLMWDLLKKSINGIINKVNISNIQNIIYELFNENLLRGQGLWVRSIMNAQFSSTNFTHVFAAVISVLNTKLPYIGNLVVHRYLIQFKKAYKRSKKILCIASWKMIAQLVNHQVIESILGYEIIILLLDNATDDSIELACNFMAEVGHFLTETSSNQGNWLNTIFETFRNILQEGKVSKRIQYIIEKLFKERKTDFKDHPSVIEELDWVNDEDRIIHLISWNSDLNGEDELDVFKYDDNYEQNENIWNSFKKEILGEEEQNQGEEEINNTNKAITEWVAANDSKKNDVNEEENDANTNNNLVDLNDNNWIKLRKVIYLTMISSVDFEECCHKLMKLNMKEGQEIEMINMIIECCIQERAYLRFYGLVAERLCLIKEIYKQNFEMQFESQYIKVHRLETNKLRNLSKWFAHLLFTNAIDWSVLKIIQWTEEDTTASSRIFCKIVFQEWAEYMGLEKWNDKLQEHANDYFIGWFCRDNPKNTRFCINFFTSIGLGALTQDLRELWINAEKLINDNEELVRQKLEAMHNEKDDGNESDSNSDSDESSSYSESRSRSESESESESKTENIVHSDSENTEKIVSNEGEKEVFTHKKRARGKKEVEESSSHKSKDNHNITKKERNNKDKQVPSSQSSSLSYSDSDSEWSSSDDNNENKKVKSK